MKKNVLFVLVVTCCIGWSADAQKRTPSDRGYWLAMMDKIARPVLLNLAGNRLKERMPVVLSPRTDNREWRLKASYLEAFGRTLSGIGPWLSSEGGAKEEVALRNQYRQWTLKAVANAVDPAAKDYLQWEGGQPLVDASFFALGLIRSPWIWEHLDSAVRQHVVTALLSTRSTVPVYSNWLLFSGMIETFFCNYGYPYDKVRIDFGVREFLQHWYVGDGLFSDGMNFAFDYYNSYVIQPYLSTILRVLNTKGKAYETFLPKFAQVTGRYAVIQERLIATDGSFPVTGRSITYRGGAFHHLANVSLQRQLPAGLHPGQVRSGLTAVLKKTTESPSTFTSDGWLNIGLYGLQPDLADSYINTGSLYLCMNLFLPLGLPETDEFWSAPAEPWTALKVWTGQSIPPDHALDVHF